MISLGYKKERKPEAFFLVMMANALSGAIYLRCAGSTFGFSG
ncbi:hypothetical protein C942_01593 [Photobacterium marinum]|uniref:Uncharacterized protein n=1 Tax=Photobacterium marinum TaxID=1056511 RepID=L8JHD0_9GAMM|nr:hypothetical protein C942_01593 [Photobacterium marinum]